MKKAEQIAQKVTNNVSELLKKYYLSGPMSGGNLWQGNKELEAIDIIWNHASYNKKQFYPETYWTLRRMAEYWRNVFLPVNYNDLSYDNQKAVNILLSCLFMFGVCALYYNKNRNALEPYLIHGPVKCDIYSEPYACTGIPAGLCSMYGALSWNRNSSYGYTLNKNSNYYTDIEKNKVELTPENSVFFCWNNERLGAWVLHVEQANSLLDTFERVETVAKLTTLMYAKKEVHGMVSKEDDEAILNNRGIIHVMADKSGNLSKFSPIENVDNGTKLHEMRDYYDWHQKWWFYQTGRRFDINEKQERNINSEVQYSNLTFAIIEKEHLKFLLAGAKRVKEKFGIDIQFDHPTINNNNDVYQDNKMNGFKPNFKKESQ